MGISAGIDYASLMYIVIAVVFFLVFALLRIRARNERVYFPKWHVKSLKTPLQREDFVPATKRNSFRAYLTSFRWIPAVLKVPEHMLIDHAGLDSAVYLRIYITGLKILVPILIIVLIAVVPVNYNNETFLAPEAENAGHYIRGIDKLSILNVPLEESKRFWTHIIVAYVITVWTCYVLKVEYETIGAMRLKFIKGERRRPSRYTVLVRNVPLDPDQTVTEHVDSFFTVNYPHQYLAHQPVYEASKISDLMNEKEETQNMLDHYQQIYDENNNTKRPMTKRGGFLGYFGYKIEDAIDFYTSEIERINSEINAERLKVEKNPAEFEKAAAFVFFTTRRGAALCAQTQQSKNPKVWLTEFAPEPRDVSWNNLAFSSESCSLPTRKIIFGICYGLLIFISTIATAFTLSYLTLDGLEAAIPGLKSIAENAVISSFVGALVPQIPLMILLTIFEYVVEKMILLLRLSSTSATERRNASWGYILLFIDCFLLIIIPADSYDEFIHFLSQSPIKMAADICRNMPEKDSFFIVYIMLSVSSVASEIFRFTPVIRFYLDMLFRALTQTEPISLSFDQEPDIQIYLLVALVYAVVSPLVLLSVILFLALSYLVYRNQFINVYHPKYESAAAFWPDVHGRIIVALLASQLLLMGFLCTIQVGHAVHVLLPLPLFTIAFYKYSKGRFKPLFLRYPIQEATWSDTLDQQEPITNLTEYLKNAYTNPAFKGEDKGDLENALEK